MCHHSSVSFNKEKICHEISEDKITVCKKTQGLRSGNFSDLNSACSKVLVPVKIFQFHDMHYESERYRDAANGLLAGFQLRALICGLIDRMTRMHCYTIFNERLSYISLIPRC